MRKLKPGYNAEEVQRQLVDKVCDYFGRVYNDSELERHVLGEGIYGWSNYLRNKIK